MQNLKLILLLFFVIAIFCSEIHHEDGAEADEYESHPLSKNTQEEEENDVQENTESHPLSNNPAATNSFNPSSADNTHTLSQETAGSATFILILVFGSIISFLMFVIPVGILVISLLAIILTTKKI